MNKDVGDILNELSCASDDEFLRMVEKYQWQFQKYSKENVKFQNLDIFLRYFNCADITKKLQENLNLQPMVETLCVHITRSVAMVDSILLNNDQNLADANLVEVLQKHISILLRLDDLLLHFLSCQGPVEEAKDLAVAIVSILLIYFQHCASSETIYRELDTSVHEQITILFKKCRDVQFHYFEFLDKLELDCKNENDFNILNVILSKVYDIGVAVSSLDLKTMAQSWKGFLSLLKSYALHVQTSFDVSGVIIFFWEEIKKKINFLKVTSDMKCRSVSLKVVTFLLKLISKLCEYFAENLDNCFDLFLQLLFFSYENSFTWFQFSTINLQVEEIRHSLLPGINPLITILVRDRSFVSYFLKRELNDTSSNRSEAGELMLLCTILEKLISCEEDVQNMWLELSVLDVTFKTLSKCHKIICCAVTVSASDASITLSQNIFLYDALIVNAASLIICTVSQDQFHILENTLVKYILQSPILVKLFIVDLWCIIGRYGSSELCFQHIRFLICLKNELTCGQVETVFLNSLIKRLFGFLCETHQIKLLDETFDHDSLFVEFSNIFSSTAKACARNNVGIATKRILDIRTKTEMSFDDDIKLLQLITVIRDINHNEQLSSWLKFFVVSQWKRLGSTHLSVIDMHLISKFLFYLCTATQTLTCLFDVTNLLQILHDLNELLKCGSDLIQLHVQRILRALATYRVDSPQLTEYCCVLASVFCTCLKNPNPVVRQSALETFSYFSHITSHEQIIQKIVANNSSLKEILSLYLQKKTMKFQSQICFERYVINLFSQTTKEISDLQSNHEEHASIKKKIKLDSLLGRKINEAEYTLRDLTNALKTRELDNNEKAALSNLITIARQLEIHLKHT